MNIGVVGVGHIGLPLAQYLHSQGQTVSSWSRSPKSFSWKNSTCLETLKNAQLDLLFLASGSARPNKGNFTTEANTTVNLISPFLISEETRIIYISSGSVYGECITAKSENDVLLPTTSYGQAKVIVENLLFQKFPQRMTTLRLGNVIDFDHPYGIVEAFLNARRQGSIKLFGEPNNCREYVHIKDFLRVIHQMLDSGEYPDRLNIASGASTKLSEIESLLTNYSHKKISVSWKNAREGDVTQTKMDISKLKDLFQFKPTSTFNVFREWLEAPVELYL